MADIDSQLATCRRFGAEFLASPLDLKVGIARQTLGSTPINGLRHLPIRGTTGWYIWSGEELGQNAGFFQPLHVSHLPEECPEVIPYLGLAPGWRFLIAPGYEDVWFDESIVHE